VPSRARDGHPQACGRSRWGRGTRLAPREAAEVVAEAAEEVEAAEVEAAEVEEVEEVEEAAAPTRR
jgi:hypothetical protein